MKTTNEDIQKSSVIVNINLMRDKIGKTWRTYQELSDRSLEALRAMQDEMIIEYNQYLKAQAMKKLREAAAQAEEIANGAITITCEYCGNSSKAKSEAMNEIEEEAYEQIVNIAEGELYKVAEQYYQDNREFPEPKKILQTWLNTGADYKGYEDITIIVN